MGNVSQMYGFRVRVKEIYTSAGIMEFAEFIKTPMVDSVTLRRPFMEPLEGTLCVTGHQLILSSRRDDHEELWVGSNCPY